MDAERFGLREIQFRAGPSPDTAPLRIAVSTVVVLIGPNGSGKSLALREIEGFCDSDLPRLPSKLVTSVAFRLPINAADIVELIDQFDQGSSPQGPLGEGERHLVQHSFRDGYPSRQLHLTEKQIQEATRPEGRAWLIKFLPAWFTARLDGRTRFLLTDGQSGDYLQNRPQNHLQALFVDDAARARVRDLTARAFGLHFVIDPTELGRFNIRMSRRAPVDIQEERGLDDRAIAFHRAAIPMDALGDGVRAFTGLVAAALSLPHRILLVDEPEAFLPPPLARRLGAALAAIARDRPASLIVDTHSAEVVLGCLESVSDTSIVRLEYDPLTGAATAKSLPSSELASLARDPLLRSTDVLRALFHRGAVVCESDADRVFYDEMNRRLLEAGRGLRDCLFLNALGKDTVHRLVGPLRRIGIPAASIVDLDMIQPGGKWRELLAACGVSDGDCRRLETQRMHVVDAFRSLRRESGASDAIKNRGVFALDAGDRARAEALIDELASYGLFLVPGGELESWLRGHGATGHGPAWVESLFAHIGSAGDDRNYLPAGADDVWAFIDGVERWIANPRPRGMA